ncbi:MAG: hypothetical protein M1840_009072 [Geoglossum simile]|nr:MAG: hypothetical protein M1840_009072 [Geoglossum simile]
MSYLESDGDSESNTSDIDDEELKGSISPKKPPPPEPARKHMVQKMELESEIKYARGYHPTLSESEIDRHAKLIKKLREKYPLRIHDIPELSDLIQLVQEYIQLGADPGLTADFFVINQMDYWAAKGKKTSDEPFDSKKEYLQRMYLDKVKHGKWVEMGVIKIQSPQKKTVKRKSSDNSFVVTKKMWKTMQEGIEALEERIEALEGSMESN